MSDTQPDPSAEPYDARAVAKDKLVCPRCEAKPGDGCETVSGEPTSLHASRVSPLEDAYEAGRNAAGVEGMARHMTAVPSQPRTAGDVPVTTPPLPQPTSPPLQ